MTSSEGKRCPYCGGNWIGDQQQLSEARAEVERLESEVVAQETGRKSALAEVERLRVEKHDAEELALSLGRTVDLLADTAEAWAALHPDEGRNSE
jgi:hypothetical protein